MFLEIINEENLNLNGFCEYLIPLIQEYAEDETNWDSTQIEKWDSELRTSELSWAVDATNTPVIPSVKFIINQYFDNLTYTTTSGNYLITSNKNLLLNYTDITINSLASRINDGILDEKGYPYFDEVFQYFANNLQEYFDDYLSTTDDEDIVPENKGENKEEDS